MLAILLKLRKYTMIKSNSLWKLEAHEHLDHTEITITSTKCNSVFVKTKCYHKPFAELLIKNYIHQFFGRDEGIRLSHRAKVLAKGFTLGRHF